MGALDSFLVGYLVDGEVDKAIRLIGSIDQFILDRLWRDDIDDSR